MRRITDIASMAMVVVVLLLGIVMPVMPDLDDDDDNVGCAAVMPVATRKSLAQAADSRDSVQCGKSNREVGSEVAAVAQESRSNEPTACAMAHVTTPLRT
jgi:hypothetical protein